MLEEGQVGLSDLLEVRSEDAAVHLDGPEELLEGAEDREPEGEVGAEGGAAEGGAGERDEARDLGALEAEARELGDAFGQVQLHISAEELRVGGDDGGGA